MHIDAGQVDGVRVQAAQGHDFFNLDHADLAAGGGGRVEVAGRLAEHQVARRVGLPRLDDRQIGHDSAFQDVLLSVKGLHVLALGNHRADAGLGVKAGNPCAPGPHAFGQRALRVEFQLQLPRKVLAHEFRILADIGRDHFLDLTRLQQHAQPEAVNARIVRGHRQVLCARLADRRDQQFGDAAQAKPAGCNQHSVKQKPVQRRTG